jgi:hypothetical protein
MLKKNKGLKDRNKMPYEKEGIFILARSGDRPEYHIAKIISERETSNPSSVGNASTRCLRYYKTHEYTIAEKEPPRDRICRKCQSARRIGS